MTQLSVTRDLEAVLAGDDQLSPDELDELMSNAYAERLTMESERMEIEREIIRLAARAGDSEAAQELRQLWLRRRTLTSQLGELRRLLMDVANRYSRAPGV